MEQNKTREKTISSAKSVTLPWFIKTTRSNLKIFYLLLSENYDLKLSVSLLGITMTEDDPYLFLLLLYFRGIMLLIFHNYFENQIYMC